MKVIHSDFSATCIGNVQSYSATSNTCLEFRKKSKLQKVKKYLQCSYKSTIILMRSKCCCITRVSEYKSNDVSKEIYYSVPFLACKMAAIAHTCAYLLCALSEGTCTFRQGAQKVQPKLRTVRLGRTVKAGRSSCSQWLEVKGW